MSWIMLNRILLLLYFLNNLFDIYTCPADEPGVLFLLVISSFTPDFISSIVSMGFFLTKVGILPETVETKDEEL